MQAGSTPSVKDNFSDLQAPNAEDLQIQLEQLVQQGTLNPEQAQAILMDQSAMTSVTTDPNLKAQQMASLSALQDLANNGGMTSMDKANLSKIATDEATKARGARDAILSNAQARGAGGSGMEILAQLQNQQDSASRQSQRDMDVAGLAQQRALDALQQAGVQSSNLRNQDFNEQATKAQAQDAISKFNAQAKQQTNYTNTSANNEAQARNLAAKQSIADSNTATRNAQSNDNRNVQQQIFDNQIKKRSGQAGIASTNAQISSNNSNANANANNQTIGTGLTAAAMFASDERLKENVEEFNPSDFLDSLTSYKYNYKNPSFGKGQNAGVMAQDLEKTNEGKSAVIDTAQGKMVDAGKASNLALAGLADINKRLKKLEGE